jgi:hypothetical protein
MKMDAPNGKILVLMMSAYPMDGRRVKIKMASFVGSILV